MNGRRCRRPPLVAALLPRLRRSVPDDRARLSARLVVNVRHPPGDTNYIAGFRRFSGASTGDRERMSTGTGVLLAVRTGFLDAETARTFVVRAGQEHTGFVRGHDDIPSFPRAVVVAPTPLFACPNVELMPAGSGNIAPEACSAGVGGQPDPVTDGAAVLAPGGPASRWCGRLEESRSRCHTGPARPGTSMVDGHLTASDDEWTETRGCSPAALRLPGRRRSRCPRLSLLLP